MTEFQFIFVAYTKRVQSTAQLAGGIIFISCSKSVHFAWKS